MVGVGARQGIGAANAVLAAKNGMHVFLTSRTQGRLDRIADEIQQAGGAATPVACNVTEEAEVGALFEQIDATGLPLRLVIYNVGRNLPAPFLQSDAELISLNWRLGVLGGLHVGQAAVRRMLTQQEIDGQRGTIVYTGASASLRGKPMFAAFASAKAGLRAMTQSMAREFGPRGIHVAHVIIDGMVDGEIVREFGGGAGRVMLGSKGEHGALQPDEIAGNYWALHRQPRSAWTHELDLRPFKETF